MADSTEKSYKFLFKVLLTGHSGSGKSSMLYRFTDDAFTEDTVPTIGLDFRVKCLEYNGSTVKLQVWDTGGQEKYRSITTSYYRGAQAVILVYDITNQESFVNLKDWLREIATYANEDVITIIVGNKCDQTEERVVDKEIAEKFAAEEGVQYMEVSAKTGDNIKEVFEKTMTDLLAIHSEDGDRLGRMKFAMAPGNPGRTRQSGCCSII